MDHLIRWSLRNRSAVVVVAGLLLAAGAYTTSTLPVDVFPDLTAPTVTVIAEARGMTPVDLEKLVTFPIESAVNGARGVRRVRSQTAVGIAVVWVEFDWRTDIMEARRVVAERLALATPGLPENVEPPFLAPITSIMGEIMFVALTSDRHDPVDLRTYADTTLRRRLLSVPGVAQVIVIGGARKEYRVTLAPRELAARSVSVGDVADALAESNENVTAGFTERGGLRHTVSGAGRLRSVEEIGEVVVRADGTVPVRVRDLGRVSIGGAPRVGSGSLRGSPAVIVGVQKQPETNTIELTDRIDAVLDELESSLPEGMRLDRRIFRQRDFIDVAVRNVFHALRDGSLLVVVLMAVFLASWRATVITLLAIPLSLCAAVVVLDWWGATINTMTLGGMAIAVGSLVDDAVIDVENVIRRLRQNTAAPAGARGPSLAVVLDASVEIRRSIAFATFIIMLVFVPIFFLAGVEGRLLRPLGVAYIVALFASLVVAVTVTPALCSYLLPGSRSVLEAREPWLARVLKERYVRVLDPALRRPWAVVAPVLLLFGLAIGGALLWGKAFLPDFNEGTLTITVGTLPGTSLEESDRLGRLAEERLLAHPEVVSTARRTGRAEGDEHVQGVESAELDVVLRMGDRSKEELLAALRRDLGALPGVVFSIGQPISHRIDHMLSGSRSSLAVKVFGPDLYRLRELAARVERAMAEVDGVVDLAREQQTDIPLLRVEYDLPALARHRLRARDLARTLAAAYRGWPVSAVLEGESAFELVLRIEDADGWGVERAAEIPIDTPGGARVPLGALARIRRDAGPAFIDREQVERKVVVQANVAGRDIGSVVADVRERVDPILATETGYRVEYGGQFESAEAARRVLLALGAAVVVGIGFLLHVAFGSIRDALFVMLNLPLAMIGAVLGVWVGGGVLSVASLIGFITVFGIAARNGIMLISHIRHLIAEEGVGDLREAVRRGAMERLVPILMTALGTALALVPLALGGGRPGSEIQTPMAIVILWGLLSSTFLNMVVVPALYLRLGEAWPRGLVSSAPRPPSEGRAS